MVNTAKDWDGPQTTDFIDIVSSVSGSHSYSAEKSHHGNYCYNQSITL